MDERWPREFSIAQNRDVTKLASNLASEFATATTVHTYAPQSSEYARFEHFTGDWCEREGKQPTIFVPVALTVGASGWQPNGAASRLAQVVQAVINGILWHRVSVETLGVKTTQGDRQIFCRYVCQPLEWQHEDMSMAYDSTNQLV